jgi:hypothetical protein
MEEVFHRDGEEERDRHRKPVSRQPFCTGVKTLAILNFLRNYVLFDSSEMNRKFDQRFKLNDKYTVMNTVEYIRMEAKEEFLAQGRTEGLTSVVNNMMATTEFSDEMIASLTGVPVDFVKEIRQEKKK